jgi:hypothetical protein
MTTRAALVLELRDRLARHGSPRLTVFVILAFAGGMAFLASVLALWAGVDSMGVRYGLAVIGGYVAFLLLIRGWIALRRHASAPDANLFDVADLTSGVSTPRRSEALDVFAGGRSGGGGGGGMWNPARDRISPAQEGQSFVARSADRMGGAFDLDELAWLIVAIVAALGGVLCVFYVVYIAPLLLAEVALDAVMVTAVYRRLRTQDAGHWAGAVVRRTWMPSVALLIFMSVVGFALQHAVPEAHSIGGVIRALVS